jgi:ribosomal protein S18 acetylase RimI-like enzyme
MSADGEAVVRVATPADAEAIAGVHVAAWRAAYRGLMPDALVDGFSLEERRRRWRENLAAAAPGVRTTVLARAGHVAGFASVGPSRDEPGGGEVWAVYVLPEAWRTGAGGRLLADGLADLARRGLAPVTLWVLEGNERAIRFYERAAFRLDGGRKLELDLPHLRMRRP